MFLNVANVILGGIHDHWVLISFFVGQVYIFSTTISTVYDGVRATLRNDILQLYDKCKIDKQITKYQLKAMEDSYTLYKKLKGNSFVDDIYEKIRKYEIID